MSDPLWVNAGRGDSVGPATISAATDQVTITGHGLNDSQPVMVAALTGGAVGVLREDTSYYVVNAAADTFQLVSAPGDEVIEFTSDGGADVYTAAPSYDAAELRRALSMFLTQGVADRFGARSGVHPGGLDAVSLSGTTWTVRDTKAVVYPGLSSLDGPYVVQLPSEAGSLNPAHASLSRTDAIDMQVQDDDHDASGFRRARVVYVPGTAGGGEPALTPNSFRMATVTVPAGGSPDPSLTYVAPYTVAAGGVLPVRDGSEGPTTGLYEGQMRFRQDTDALEAWTGSTFTPLAHPGGWTHIAAGTEPASTSSFSIDLTAAGRFPAGTFELIRVYFRGRTSDDGTRLNVRVNGDDTAGMHERGFVATNYSTGAVVDNGSSAVTSWPVAEFSTFSSNLAKITIYNTNTSALLSYEAEGERVASTDSFRRTFRSGGRINASRLLDSLSVFPFTGTIEFMRWWAEGYLAP